MFVRLEGACAIGIIERIGMHKQGYRTPEDYPAIGSTIVARVLGFRDYNHEVDLELVWRPPD